MDIDIESYNSQSMGVMLDLLQKKDQQIATMEEDAEQRERERDEMVQTLEMKEYKI